MTQTSLRSLDSVTGLQRVRPSCCCHGVVVGDRSCAAVAVADVAVVGASCLGWFGRHVVVVGVAAAAAGAGCTWWSGHVVVAAGDVAAVADADVGCVQWSGDVVEVGCQRWTGGRAAADVGAVCCLRRYDDVVVGPGVSCWRLLQRRCVVVVDQAVVGASRSWTGLMWPGCVGAVVVEVVCRPGSVVGDH